MRDRVLITWLAVLVALLVMLNLPGALSRDVKSVLREGLAPLQKVLSGASFRVREGFSTIRGLGGLARENQRMAEEMIRLRNEVRRMRHIERENRSLREQLSFFEQADWELTPCEVIGRDVSGWWQSVRLDKGLAEGVLPDRAVITSDGLVGKTLGASAGAADVLLLSDPTCQVSARITRTGAFGIVQGRGPVPAGRALCRMQFINKNLSVRPGDEVVTSGLGGIYPRGLLVGYVEKVYTDATGLYQYADIFPKADLGRLSYVFVVAEERDPVVDLLRRKRNQQEGAP